MAQLTCPDCGADVDVRPFLALHRWPAAYPEDAAAAIVPCTEGDALSARIIVIDDDIEVEVSIG